MSSEKKTGSGNHQAAEDSDRHPEVDRPLAVVCIPPAQSKQECAEQKKNKRRKIIKFWAQIVIAIATVCYLCATILIWRETKRATETASKQLEMMDRPWIRDTVLSAFDMGWQHDGTYLGWAVTIRAANVGHSVATGIFPKVKLIAIEGANFIDYPRQEANKVCEEAATYFDKFKSDPTMWATSVFPDEPPIDFPGQNVYLMPFADKRNVVFDGGKDVGRSVIPMLVGCIVYHYPSSEHPHHTGFVYTLSHSDDSKVPEPARVFFPIGKDVPKDKIILTKVGQFAD
jgi:hypothetical protein